jgi:hypothetical protein
VSVSAGRKAAVSEELRTRLVALANELVPEAEGMPAACAVDVGGKQLDLVLTARPDLEEPLVRGLSRAEHVNDALAWMERLGAEDPEAYEGIAATVIGGYYMHPEVKARLGYPGQAAREVNVGGFPEYVSEGLLERVVERGSIYRPTPPDA